MPGDAGGTGDPVVERSDLDVSETSQQGFVHEDEVDVERFIAPVSVG